MTFLPASTPPAQPVPPSAATTLGTGAQPARGWSRVWSQASALIWVLAGKFVLMGANATLMLLLAERLDLEAYGLLVTIISAQLLISRGLMLGVDAGMIRMRTVPELRQQAPAIVQAGLVVMGYTTAGLVLCTLAGVWFWPVSVVPRWPSGALTAVVLGAIGTALVDYNYGFYLAQLQYRVASVVQSGTALMRLVVTVGAVQLLPHYTAAVFLSYTGASFLAGAAQTGALLRRQGQRPARALVWRLLRYSWWQCMTNVIVVFSLYQGTFLLTALGQQAATGIFGLGLTLSLGFFAVYNAFIEYLLPRGARVGHVLALPRFLARACGSASVLAVACGLATVAIGMAMPRLLRPELHEVVPIFYLLSASMLLLILQCPFEVASHYFLRPQWVVFTWALRALSIGLLVLFCTPIQGAAGVALAQLVGTGLALLVLIVLVSVQMRSALHRARGSATPTALPE